MTNRLGCPDVFFRCFDPKRCSRIAVIGLGLSLAGCSSTDFSAITTFFEPSKPTQTANRSAVSGKSATGRDNAISLAQTLQASGKSAEALAAWTNLRATYGDEQAILLGLGEAHLSLNQVEDALVLFERVVKTDASNGAGLSGLGRSLVKAGEGRAALGPLDLAATVQPWDVKVWNARGVALDLVGRHVEAEASYRIGLNMEPENPTLRNNLGLSLALAGRPDEAIALLEPMAVKGEDPRARQTLSLVYGLKGDDQAARELATEDMVDADADRNVEIFKLLRQERG